VTSEIELAGAGSETTIVDGSALDFGGQAIFEVRAGGVLRVHGVTLREGQSSCVRVTGASGSAGALSLEDAVLEDCVGSPGYGIDNSDKGELARGGASLEAPLGAVAERVRHLGAAEDPAAEHRAPHWIGTTSPKVRQSSLPSAFAKAAPSFDCALAMQRTSSSAPFAVASAWHFARPWR